MDYRYYKKRCAYLEKGSNKRWAFLGKGGKI
jgi:hypothetical protein